MVARPRPSRERAGFRPRGADIFAATASARRTERAWLEHAAPSPAAVHRSALSEAAALHSRDRPIALYVAGSIDALWRSAARRRRQPQSHLRRAATPRSSSPAISPSAGSRSPAGSPQGIDTCRAPRGPGGAGHHSRGARLTGSMSSIPAATASSSEAIAGRGRPDQRIRAGQRRRGAPISRSETASSRGLSLGTLVVEAARGAAAR